MEKSLTKVLKIIFLLLFAWSLWAHEPWFYLWNWTSDSAANIPIRLQLISSSVLAFLLVIIVEWLKGSTIEFNELDSLEIPEDNPTRKFLKIGVSIKERWVYRIFGLFKLPLYVHSLATLTINISHSSKQSYRAKWDIAPEPLEYPHLINQDLKFQGEIKNRNGKPEPVEINGSLTGKENGYPRVEMLPLAMREENLLPGDTATISILVKHKDMGGFYIYDPEYYFDGLRETKNYCKSKKAYLCVRFRSSLGSKKEYYRVLNPNTTLEGFTFEKISKNTYKSKTEAKGS